MNKFWMAFYVLVAGTLCLLVLWWLVRKIF
jgi:hypothetical protein